MKDRDLTECITNVSYPGDMFRLDTSLSSVYDVMCTTDWKTDNVTSSSSLLDFIKENNSHYIEDSIIENEFGVKDVVSGINHSVLMHLLYYKNRM